VQYTATLAHHPAATGEAQYNAARQPATRDRATDKNDPTDGSLVGGTYGADDGMQHIH